jgi:hypothetical protein
MRIAMTRPRFLTGLFALSSVLSLVACGGGGEGGSVAPAGPPVADLLLTDAPADELLYLQAEVTSFKLVDFPALGGETENLINGPVIVDLLSLQGVSAWLAKAELPEGTYGSARLEFNPLAWRAAGLDGVQLTPSISSSVLQVPFSQPLVVGSTGYTQVQVDFDVASSISGSVATTVTITPNGSAIATSGDDGIAIDEVKGRVLTKNAAAGTLTIDAFADGDLAAPLGTVTVSTLPETYFVGDDGLPFASAGDFFASLTPNSSLVEVHGNLVSGSITATKIEIEDSFGGTGEAEVELKGKLVAHDPGVSITVLWNQVKKGASTFLDAFSPGDPPATIQASITPQTVFELDSSIVTTEASLAIGQELEVKFKPFTGSPSPAIKVEIEDAFPEFEGVLTDDAGLPDSFVMRLSASQPAILSGEVDSSSTDVTVNLSGTTPPSFVLDVEDGFPLTASDLQNGLEVKVYGTLSGPSSGPTIEANSVEVDEGELDDAIVSTADEANSSFTTSTGSIDEPFGQSVAPGPQTVIVEPGCVFEGEAISEQQFFALSNSGIIVDVEGIGATDTLNTIRAYYIFVDLE